MGFSLHRFANISVLAVMLISAVSLLGWWIDHAALASWLPGIADMTFNTAICFMLVSIACLPAAHRYLDELFRMGICGFVALFAGLSLLQGFFGVDIGIDNLLFDSHGHGLSSPYPGRMSPNTALGFLLIAFVLIALSKIKHNKRLITITHSVIMMLGMVALLGIAMNVLMYDVPDGFAHFASMSLLSAIAFFLLSIGLASIFEQQNSIENSSTLFHSGIQLMYMLSYPKKFALISVIVAIPLTGLIWNEIELLVKNVAQTQLKLTAITHIKMTSRLITAISEHRGMQHASIADAGKFSVELALKEQQVDQLFTMNAQLDRSDFDVIEVPDDWRDVESHWNEIKKGEKRPLLQWRLHTELVALLIGHMRNIGAATRLSFDEDPMLHNLVEAQLFTYPDIFEKVAQIRGFGSAFIAAREISNDQQLIMEDLIHQVSMTLTESLNLTALARLNSGFVIDEKDHIALIRDFITTSHVQLLDENLKFTINTEDYFQQATLALRKGYDFYYSGLDFMQGMLEQSVDRNLRSQFTIKLVGIMVMLLLLFIFISFYKSVMLTISALNQAAERMKKGDVGGIDLSANDELGDVASAFNAIAEELVKVSSHMSAVVDHAVDGIITINSDGRIKLFNPASEYIFGYTFDEVLGKDITMLMPEQYREGHRTGLQRYCDTSEARMIGRPFELEGLRKDGAAFPMELSITEMNLEGKQMFIGVVRETTERHELENQLRHSQKMEAVGALVGGVAHNFNNLLAGILGKAYMARMKLGKSEDALPYLNSIESISLQAGEMVKQLLTFAHKDFFQHKQITPLDLLIKEGFNTVKLGISEDIDLSINIMMRDMMINCDATQIQQVLMNMMNNARDALADSDEKRMAVRLTVCQPDEAFYSRHENLEKGKYACLTISDSGHGMDAQTREKIFDPFYTTKDVGSGTGLGLSSAFGTVKSHGGVIEVDSGVGQGTTFSVYLPLVEGAGENVEGPGEGALAYSENRELLLLVEDDLLILESVQEVLEELGYDVITANNGLAGLDCFKVNQDRIAAVITDVVMPKMGGVEMFRRIRQLDSAMPTLFVTGYDRSAVQLSDDEKCNTGMILKPVQIPAFSTLVYDIIQNSVDVDS